MMGWPSSLPIWNLKTFPNWQPGCFRGESNLQNLSIPTLREVPGSSSEEQQTFQQPNFHGAFI